MRTRVITSPSFTGERILGAILFEDTMDLDIEPTFRTSRPHYLHDLGNPLAERSEPLEEDLGPGGLDPGGDQPAGGR
jgi:hypothetical protein